MYHDVKVMHDDEMRAGIVVDGKRRATRDAMDAQNMKLDGMAQYRADHAGGEDYARGPTWWREPGDRTPSSVAEVDGRYN